MIDYKSIKEVLRVGIWDDLGAFLVELENGDKRPDNQPEITSFVSHKITSPYIKGGLIEGNDDNFFTHEATPKVAVSFTCYSRDKVEALNLCHRLIKWFEFNGREYLKGNDLIIVEVTNITDRTTFLETGYDNRVGFDVIFRTTDNEYIDLEWIEFAEVNKNRSD